MNVEKVHQPGPALRGLSRLSVFEFNQLAQLVYSQCGIRLSAPKKTMLESRLNKRLRETGLPGFREYIQYLSTNEGISNELVHMIDEVTTNKTDFFREPHHFDYLRQFILPLFQKEKRRNIKIWSAACSSGEEPYTLAMVLQDFISEHPGLDYSIFASDISTHVLRKAAAAIYTTERVSDIPLLIKQKYFLKSKDQEKPTVRIVPQLRRKVSFARVNFMDEVLPVDELFDVIFCRNVLIYFDKQTQQEVLLRLCNKLKTGAYLFVGHSESLFQLRLPLKQIKPTIYQRI